MIEPCKTSIIEPIPKDFDKCEECSEFRCVKENALTYCPILTEEAMQKMEGENAT